MRMEVERLAEPGLPAPLGAHLRDGGCNVAVFAEHATAVDLCLFDDGGARPETRPLRLHGPRGSAAASSMATAPARSLRVLKRAP